MNQNYVRACLYVNRVYFVLIALVVVICSFTGFIDGDMIIGMIVLTALPFCVNKFIKTNGTGWAIGGVITTALVVIGILGSGMWLSGAGLFYGLINGYNIYILISMLIKPELRMNQS